MPIYTGGGGVAGITVESDPSALKMANNLSDLINAGTARTNLQLSTFYAAVSHSHAITDVANLQTTLNGKAATSHSHAMTDVTGLSLALSDKAPSNHSHSASQITGWQDVAGSNSGYVLSLNGTSLQWVAQSGGISDAPIDGVKYGRFNGTWSAITEGTVGPQGPAGPAGSLVYNYLGAYDNGVTYTVDDAVTFQGQVYVMTTSVGAAGYDPVAHPSYWTLFVAKGADGADGADGVDGAVTSAEVQDYMLTYVAAGGGVACQDSMGTKILVSANYQPQVANDYTGPYVGQNGGWVQLPAYPISSVSTQANASGYSNAQFDTTHYPTELALTINGVTYYVPARS